MVAHEPNNSPQRVDPISDSACAPFVVVEPHESSESDDNTLSRILINHLWSCAAILCAHIFSYLLSNTSSFAFTNATLPFFFLLTSFWASYSLIRYRKSLLWTPMPWFLAAAGLYFGFGPLLYFYGSDEAISFVHTFYFVDEWGIYKANVLNVLGTSIAVIAYLVASYLFFKLPATVHNVEFDPKAARTVAIIFLVIGLPVKYFLALPFAFGYFNFVLSGSIQQLEYFTSFAVIIFVLLVAKGFSEYRPILYTLVASELLVSILTFSKLQLIWTIITIVFGLSIFNFRIQKLILGGIIAVGVYFIATPLIPFGRVEIVKEAGSHSNAGLSDRMRIFIQYLSGERLSGINEYQDSQSWWTRLNYTPAEVFCLEAYDAGDRGDSLDLLLVSLVPRFIWPEKVIISDIGSRFNQRVTGNPDSQSAPGIFAEGYWDGGWILFGVIAFSIGVLFSWLTQFSVSRMESLKLGYLPCIFLSIKMGFRLDGWFIIEYWGAMISFFGLFILASMFYGMIGRKGVQLS